MTSRFSNFIINQILYSGIRNNHHLKIRRRGYFRHLLKLTFLLLFRSRKEYKVNSDCNIVDFVSGSNFKLHQNSLPANISVVNTENESFLWIEWYLTIGFLANYKPFQKWLFKKASEKSLKFFKEYKVEILLCGHPTFFITFLTYILKIHKKKVVTIQHGIYNLNFYKVLWFEKEIATNIIVFGKYFKDLYISQGVDENKVIVGSPYFQSKILTPESVSIKLNKKKVVFIGQQLYKVNSSIVDVYNKTLSSLYYNLEKRGMEFHYKPHPREDINESLDSENSTNFKICRINDKNAFWETYDIFLSANSSLLVESYHQKKICFQVELLNSEMEFDNFNDYSGIPLIKSSNISNFPFEGDYKFYSDPNYLNLIEKPNERLLFIILNFLKSNKHEL